MLAFSFFRLYFFFAEFHASQLAGAKSGRMIKLYYNKPVERFCTTFIRDCFEKVTLVARFSSNFANVILIAVYRCCNAQYRAKVSDYPRFWSSNSVPNRYVFKERSSGVSCRLFVKSRRFLYGSVPPFDYVLRFEEFLFPIVLYRSMQRTAFRSNISSSLLSWIAVS